MLLITCCRRRLVPIVLVLSIALQAQAQETEGREQLSDITILVADQVLTVEMALATEVDLWIPVDCVPHVTGFEVKPEGVCCGDICIPFPPDAEWVVEHEGSRYFAVTQFAERIDQVVATEPGQRLWGFGQPQLGNTSPLVEGKAPEFTIADREGNPVSLSDFRGKKVLVLTWASW